MKLFGSKDDQEQEDVFAEEVDGAESADESFEPSDDAFAENAGGALSAPSRKLEGGGGKGKKGLLLGVLGLLLVGGGGGGAYYYMMMMEEPVAAPRVAKVLTPKGDAPAPAAATNAAPGAVPPAMDVTADIMGAPPMPQVPADMPQDPLLAAAPATPAASEAGALPDAAASAANGAAPAVDPFTELGAPPSDPAAPVGAAATPVPAATATPDTAAPVTAAPDALAAAPDMPDEAPMTESFAPLSVAETPADTAAPAPDTAAAAPKEDLPMPRMLETAAPATPQTATDGAVTGATAAPAAQTTAPATNAEKAIVENAAVLDQLSAPAAATAADPAAAGKTINEILGGGQDAIVRPMPDSYVVVRKETDGSALAARLKQGRSALMNNNDMAALQMFNEMQQDFPRDNRVSMGRALAMQKLGQYDQALGAYEEILEKDPKNLEALTNMLGILKQQNPSLALEKLGELREAYPFNADIAAQLGVAYASMQSYAEALKYFDIADALKPGNGYVMYNRAVALDRMGQEEKAAAVYRLIVRLAAEGALKEPVPVEVIRQRLSTMR